MKTVLLSLLSVLILQACMEPRYVAKPMPVSLQSGRQSSPDSFNETADATVEAPDKDNYSDYEVTYHLSPLWSSAEPKCIAVLPLSGDGIAEARLQQIRSALTAQLAPRGYELVEPARVDWAIGDGQTVALNELAKKLDCDAFLRGRVTEFSEQYFAVYSRISAGASIEIVRASDQAPLWSASHTATLENGGLALTPVGLATSLVSAVVNLREEQSYRVADDLGRRLLKALPMASREYPETDIAVEKKPEAVSPVIPEQPAPETKDKLDFALIDALEPAEQIVRLKGWLADKTLNPVQKEAVFAQLAAREPSATLYQQWSRFRQIRGDYEAAAQHALHASELAPRNPEVRALRARLALVMGKPEEALQQYLKAVSLAPDQGRFYAELAHSYEQLGELERARAAYGMAVQKNPDLAFAWYNLAVMDFNAADFEPAARKFHLAASAYIDQGFPDIATAVIEDLKTIHSPYAEQAVRQLSLQLSQP